MEKDRELKEFVKWFNERNDFPKYPSFHDVDMFLSLNSHAPAESRSVSENEQAKEVINASLAWLGYWRDKMPNDAVNQLQDILITD